MIFFSSLNRRRRAEETTYGSADCRSDMFDSSEIREVFRLAHVA
jgi:hypothetical protein